MKFRKGNAEIILNHPHTFNVALRAGFEPVEENEKKGKPEKGQAKEPEQEQTGEQDNEEAGKNEEEKVFKCKKCDFETTNKGQYLVHCKTHKE